MIEEQGNEREEKIAKENFKYEFVLFFMFVPTHIQKVLHFLASEQKLLDEKALTWFCLEKACVNPMRKDKECQGVEGDGEG